MMMLKQIKLIKYKACLKAALFLIFATCLISVTYIMVSRVLFRVIDFGSARHNAALAEMFAYLFSILITLFICNIFSRLVNEKLWLKYIYTIKCTKEQFDTLVIENSLNEDLANKFKSEYYLGDFNTHNEKYKTFKPIEETEMNLKNYSNFILNMDIESAGYNVHDVLSFVKLNDKLNKIKSIIDK